MYLCVCVCMFNSVSFNASVLAEFKLKDVAGNSQRSF